VSLRPIARHYQQEGYTLVTGPAAEPVTADDLRAQLNGVSDTDAYLEGLIAEAREEVEYASGLALISQTWRLTIDCWPGYKEQWWDGVREGHRGSLSMGMAYGGAPFVTLRRMPLASITSVTVYGEDSVATAVDVAATFDVDTAQKPGRLALKSGAAWPVALRAVNAIEIVHVSGYGDAASDVPGPIRRAVRQLAAYAYGHRGDGCDMGSAYHASGAAEIVSRYRNVRI